jgi:hypothetical protein
MPYAFRRISSIALMAAVCAACGNRKAEVKSYATANAAQLVESSRTLWQQSKPPASRTLSPADLPPPFKPLGASLVASSEHGLQVFIMTSPIYITGIFIRFDRTYTPPGPTPPDTDLMGFEELAPDVYWFSRPR